jgi:ELWxxDGT repeat protein
MLLLLVASAPAAGQEPTLVRAFEQFTNARSPALMRRGCGTPLFHVWLTPPPGYPLGPPGDVELWKTDGTAAGTAPVFDTGHVPSTCLHGKLYYPGRENTLRRTQAVPASETIVFQWDDDGFYGDMFKFGDLLFIRANDGVHGWEPWISDGTTAGTKLLKDIDPGDPLGLGAIGDRFYFSATDGRDRHGRELWVTDGTKRGTKLVKDIRPGPRGSFFGSPMRGSVGSQGRKLYVSVDDHKTGLELWKSDGTADGTKLLRDIRPGREGSDPRSLVTVDGIVYFTADDGTSGRELWRTDGSRSGTRRVKDVRPGALGSAPRELVGLRDMVNFSATDDTSGREIWVSRGTPATTRRLKDIRPGSMGSKPGELERVGGGPNAALYFSANDGRRGRELWGTDGTGVGTRRISDIRPGSKGSNPTWLLGRGGELFFGATDGTIEGSGLWKYDKPAGDV